MTTAKLLKSALKARKMSPAEFARSVGRSRSTIHAWLHGGPGPKLCHLEEISEALGIEYRALLDSHLERAA